MTPLHAFALGFFFIIGLTVASLTVGFLIREWVAPAKPTQDL